MYSLLSALCLQIHFSFYPKRRERPGWQEERGKPTAEPVLGREGKPREEGQGGNGEGVFWKRRRLFLSQERREYCLKQQPSWGCATSRSPTSNGLCVRLSHGADSGFESLLCSLASPVPLPSPCCPAVSLLRTPRPRVCETLLRSLIPTSPKPPLHLPRLSAPTSSPLEGWKCFCPADPALTGSRLWPQLRSPTRWPGLGHRVSNGKNWGAGGSEPEGTEGEQPGYSLRGTHPGQRLLAGQPPWAGK